MFSVNALSIQELSVQDTLNNIFFKDLFVSVYKSNW